MILTFAYNNKEILNECFSACNTEKRPELLEVTPLILHDNAACHKAKGVTSLLDMYCWEVLPHPAYSPDMSPPIFDFFSKLKEPLRMVGFEDLESFGVEVSNQVRRINFGA